MEKKKRNKIFKITGIVLGSLLILLIAGVIFINAKADDLIVDEFSRLTNGRYRLEAKKIDVNILGRSVRFEDLRIIPTNPADVQSDTDAPVALIHFAADMASVNGVRYKDAEGRRNISVGKVNVVSPRIKYEQTASEKTLGPDAADSLKEKKSPDHFSIDVSRIDISDGHVEYNLITGSDTVRSTFAGFELESDDFRFTNERPDGYAKLPVRTLKVSVAKITHIPADPSSRFEIDSVWLSSGDSLLRIASLALVPSYMKDEYAHKARMHKDWGRASFSGISCHGIDFDRLFAEGVLLIDSVRISGGGYSSYKNRNVVRKEWIKPLHYQAIQRLPIKFLVRTASLEGINAQYEELTFGADRPGIITFREVGGTIDGLSNIMPSPDGYSKWDLKAKIYGEAPLHVTGYMPIDSLNDNWRLAASVSGMRIALLNNMITPLNNIQVTSGRISRMDFNIAGTSVRSHVDMTLLYDDLKIALLKDKNGSVKRRGFLSGVVNDMVLLRSNPLYGETRRSKGEFTRDPKRSPWNYLWKSVFVGAKDAVGMGEF